MYKDGACKLEESLELDKELVLFIVFEEDTELLLNVSFIYKDSACELEELLVLEKKLDLLLYESLICKEETLVLVSLLKLLIT